MKRTLFALMVAAVLPLSAHAAEFKIHETDNEIIVEYNGDGKAAVMPLEIAPVEVKPAPTQVAVSSTPSPVEEDEEETRSVGKLARKEQALAKAKERVAREKREKWKTRNLSTISSDDYYQAQSVPE
ncbi:hypothetical protein E4633_18540 [Geomonas terrae]|uniref:DUF4124 domain-containing protein n=1 Tax=Geomonas terrae TaxID=2562681 RepID=A0A4S1CA83_9BACT|nr:hypothetical protein [Geomonas terrae]TGU70198.1 hypothetical protein E4633_18540 [Geomonas terrae]